MVHSSLYLAARHDLLRVCALIAVCAIVKNFLPAADRFRRHPTFYFGYLVLVDLLAGFGGSWRVEQPCLELEFMGFKRKVRHGFLNWRQQRLDRKEQ